MKTSLLIFVGIFIAIAGGITGYLDYKASIPEYTRTGVPQSIQREYDSYYRDAKENEYQTKLERCGSKTSRNSYLTIFAITKTYSYGTDSVTVTYYSEDGVYISSDYSDSNYEELKPGMYREKSLIDISTYSCLLLSTTVD